MASPAGAVDLSPVTRVVELLKGLAEQAEKEGKTEEGLYEDYVCWGKAVINQKTASNAATALKSAIDTLGEATKDHKDGVLLAVRASLRGASKNGGMAELAQHLAALKQAVELGERFLAK